MPEIRSPLTEVLKYGLAGAAVERPGIVLTERPLGTLIQLAGWRRFEADLSRLLETIGLPLAGDFRTVARDEEMSAFRVAPDRLLLRNADPAAIAEAAADGDLACLDLSHARCVVCVEGAFAGDLLARLTSVDLSPAAFPPGTFVQCGIHGVGVLIERHAGDRFDLFLPVTWAASLWAFVADHAQSFGYSVMGRAE